MATLSPQKLVHVIANAELEELIVGVIHKHELPGYTAVRARGEGTTGMAAGTLDFETNVVFLIILPEERMDAVLNDLERLQKKGHHLLTFVTDVGLLPRG
jgi:hypothetical protein